MDGGKKSKKLSPDCLAALKISLKDKEGGYKKLYRKYGPQWGVGLYTIKSACDRIVKRDFSTARPAGSGRPKTAATSPNIQKVREHLANEALPDEEKSLAKTSKATGLSRRTTQRIIKDKLKQKSLTKIKVQYVRSSNAKKRLEISQRWKAEMGRDWKFDPRSVFWTDEKVFRLGKVEGGNQNYRVWVDEATTKANLPTDKIIRGEGQSQGGASVMVALGASWPGGLGTVRFVKKGSKINSQTYQEIVENTYLVDCLDHFGPNHYVFQQDGATSHAANATQAYLDDNCPSFIKKADWPANSPDLNPLDYFIWGYLQREVDKKKPEGEAALKLAIRNAARDMPIDMLRKGIDGSYKRVALRIEAEGKPFKHKLKRKPGPIVPGRDAEGQEINIDIEVEIQGTKPKEGGDDDAMDVDSNEQ